MATKPAIIALRNGNQEWTQYLQSNEPLDFTDGDLTTCNLENRDFTKEANFNDATFGGINISNGQIHRSLTFKRATFKQLAQIRPSLATPPVSLDFSEAEFLADVRVDGGPSPAQNLVFAGATFHGALTIYGGRHCKLDFTGAKFLGDVTVMADNGKLIFASAKFGGGKQPASANFQGAIIHKGGDFANAEFFGPADFENADFKGSSSFVGCTFHQAPNFHNASLHQGTLFSPQTEFPRLFRDTQSVGASNAYRTLKLAMNDQHALAEELGFFLLEMRSSAHHQRPLVKLLYWLYDGLSRYGMSVKRPLMFLIAVNVVAGLLFSLLAGRGWGAWDSELLALTLYGAIPFAPALRSQVPDMSSLFPVDVLALVPVVVAVQGLFNAALLFLVILGLRNMFKIK